LNHRPLDWQSGPLPCDHRSPCACSLYCFWRLCRLNVWRWGVLTPSVWASGGQRGRLWSSVYSVGEVARTMHYVLLRIVFKLIIPFGSVVVLIICNNDADEHTSCSRECWSRTANCSRTFSRFIRHHKWYSNCRYHLK